MTIRGLCISDRARVRTSRIREAGRGHKQVLEGYKVMLDVFITSRVRRKIIVIYAKYPDFKTHVRGLAKLIKEDAGNIQRELKRLEKVGFLHSEKQGNTKIYYTNKQFPIFKELQSIVLKSQRTTQKKTV